MYKYQLKTTSTADNSTIDTADSNNLDSLISQVNRKSKVIFIIVRVHDNHVMIRGLRK